MDGKQRPYLLVEMGDYFDKTLIRRVKKVIYSDDWRNGNPVGKGTSHLLQYLRLEQYEDTLNNIEFRDDVVKTSELSFLDRLRYSLDYGTRASDSLLRAYPKIMERFHTTWAQAKHNKAR